MSAPTSVSSKSESSSASYHAIEVAKGQDLIEYCPDRAATGETVEFDVLDVTDVLVVVKVDGKEVDRRGGHGYMFEMPDDDVVIEVTLEDYPWGGGA